MLACHFHADRPALGVCMRCRRPICAACCTRLDGVNHCHACLKAMARREAAPRRPAAGAPWAVVAAVALAGGGLGLFLLGLLVEGWMAP